MVDWATTKSAIVGCLSLLPTTSVSETAKVGSLMLNGISVVRVETPVSSISINKIIQFNSSFPFILITGTPLLLFTGTSTLLRKHTATKLKTSMKTVVQFSNKYNFMQRELHEVLFAYLNEIAPWIIRKILGVPPRLA